MSSLEESASPPLFEVRGLTANARETEILRGIDLSVGAGEIHAVMGPVGSGKSTMAKVLLDSPEFTQTGGSVHLKGDNITDWCAEVRGKAGIFLAFQYPEAIPGVSVINFLCQALSARKGIDLSVVDVRRSIMEWMERLDMDPSFADRHLNEGFSDAEKKRNELLQMAILEPELAILDETDSGLDLDALQVIAKGVREVRIDSPDLGVIVLTQHQLLLDYLKPDFVHILIDGAIVESGDAELAQRLEAEGFEGWQ